METNKLIGRCKTCKFWGSDSYSCDKVDDSDEVLMRTSKEPDDAFRINVRALDDHGLEVDLIVGPEFGCVKYESTDR
jgi:hypothetical protein